MDQPCSYEDLRACLRSISSISRLTLGYRPTLSWLETLRRAKAFERRPVQIVDVGCGDGGMLRRIHHWAARSHIAVTLTGIDLNANAIRAAREATPPGVATFHLGDAFAYTPADGIDIVVSSLVTHHLENAAIVEFLAWMEANARVGWFINDLHRQPIPYRLFRLLARVAPWHPFARHDGAVSILRSFRRDDWTRLLQTAAIPPEGCRVEEFRPGRLCVARKR